MPAKKEDKANNTLRYWEPLTKEYVAYNHLTTAELKKMTKQLRAAGITRITHNKHKT